jgi:hypothetical protein
MSERIQKKAVADAVNLLYDVASFKVSTAAPGISRGVLPPLGVVSEDRPGERVAHLITLVVGQEVNSITEHLFLVCQDTLLSIPLRNNLMELILPRGSNTRCGSCASSVRIGESRLNERSPSAPTTTPMA